MKSVLTPQQQFARIANPKIQRSTFNRSHGKKTTFDAGQLIPIYVDEALPGDTFKMNTTIFARLATPLRPFMDNVYMDVHYFSVPIRLVWENWEKMNGEQDNPGDTTDYTMPTLTSGSSSGYAEDSIFDYMGIPTKVKDLTHRVDFLRAVNLIWNEWYRDENLQDSAPFTKADFGDIRADYEILPRGKRKDYFTSALPFAQKADPVTIPLGDTAPVVSTGSTIDLEDTATYPGGTNRSLLYGAAGSANLYASGAGIPGVPTSVAFADSFDALEVDLTSATAATVNAWRQAFQFQVMYELDARGGTRYIETILAHFGVRSPDQRLQRPEYLGGFTTQVNVNPIANTSGTATENQGDLAAIGTAAKTGRGFVKSFTEHEIILGFVSARADLNYQQGLNRMWTRSTRFDHYWPPLAHLGEQTILNKELYAQGSDGGTDDEGIFGYQERYSEYKYKPSEVTSKFRSNHTASLDVWHLSQDFSSLPVLNDAFIEENPPIDRVIAVPTEPHFILDVYFDLICARPMPVYSTPHSLTKL